MVLAMTSVVARAAVPVSDDAKGQLLTNKSLRPDAAAKSTLLNERLMNGSRRRASSVSRVSASAVMSGQSYDFIMGPDDEQWSYSQTFVESGYYYTSSTLKFYDNTHTLVGTVTVDVSDISNVNQISVSTNVTNTFYDLDDTTHEITLWYHTANNGVTSTVTRAYRIETGELLFEFEGSSILCDASTDEYNKYQRLMIITDSTATVEVNDTTEEVDYDIFTMYAPMAYGDTALTVDHVFTLETELSYYMSGADINFWVVDGEPYYTTAQYEQPYIAEVTYDTSDGSYGLEPTEDNRFVVKVYDGDYELVDSIAVAIECPDDAYLRMAAFGMLGDDDLSKGYFIDDDSLTFVITWDDYITSDDADRYQFDVYNNLGEYQKTVCDNVYNEYYMLASVRGHEDQMMFMQIIDDEQQIQMVDLPSCTYRTVIPATVEDDESITTELNRYPKGNTYQYIVKLAYATSDDDGNVIARLGWYDTDVNLDHYTSFNLGEYGENFRPGLYDNMLNPYIFNTDDGLEYIYFAKIANDSTTTIYDYLCVADEDGELLFSVGPDDDLGTITTAYLLTEGMESAELAVVYIDSDYENYSVQFYELPFVKFSAGGTGTSSDPYIISTVGDLVQVGGDTDAYYRIVNDLDMSDYPFTWTTVSTFSGQIDGENHYIQNLYVSTDEYYAGMFGYLERGGVLKNIVLLQPEMQINDGNEYVGTITGATMGGTFENIHIYNGILSDPSSSVNASAVGGIVGSASTYTTIESCSYRGSITAEACASTGGIAGFTRTTSTTDNAYVEGTLTGSVNVGGIIGTTYSSSDVTNSHVNADIVAGSTVGGIVGYNSGRVLIDRCYAEGTITAQTQPKWDGMNVGGIVGDLESDWSQTTATSADAVVSNCIAAADIIVTAGEDNDSTIHRIVGSTIYEETWEEDETPVSEMGLSNNFALATMTVNGDTISSDDATSSQGATITAEDLTQTFLADSLGYVYGDDADSPWKGDGLPVLYYEDLAAAIVTSAGEILLAVDETYDLTVTVYGTGADDVDVSIADNDIAEIELSDEGDDYIILTVIGVAEGETTLTITADSLTSEITVTVSDVTGIRNVETLADGLSRSSDGRIYNLQGMEMKTVVQKGIYIRNGRKYIIK